MVEKYDDLPWLNGLTREQLEARIGEAELRIEEETSVLAGCKRRVALMGGRLS